jgi:type IV pilus assembly protein PilW
MGLRAQAGFSLIELMVALVVGLMVVGALLSTYYAILVSNKHGQAMSQVTEDASVGLNILRANLAQAGFSNAYGTNAGLLLRNYSGVAVRGCDSAFSNTAVAIGALTCVDNSNNAALTDSLAVAYEADVSNSTFNTGTNAPYDCIGNTWAAVPAAAPRPAYWLAYSRFYLATPAGATNPALYCIGPGNAAGQVLVENIVDMQIRYGVAANMGSSPVQVAYYTDASTLAGVFTNVVSVRVCLLVSSVNEVVDKLANNTFPQYVNCSGNKVTPANGRLYRAFTSTIVLQNRVGVIP